MAKNIVVMGTGYVGLVAAAGLADFGNRVTAVDVDAARVGRLQRGEVPIYEPGLEDYIRKAVAAGRLAFDGDIEQALVTAQCAFIAVGTPSSGDLGDVDLSAVDSAVEMIARVPSGPRFVVIKSTVPVGTAERMGRLLLQAGTEESYVISNPEFLREGHAVQDFFHPDKIVIGCDSQEAHDFMIDVYRPLYLLERPFVFCDNRTAELIKYANNAFLATKVAFINQLAELCECTGADVQLIAKAMGMDGRISSKFLHAGPGFGGSCFPKDTRALCAIGVEHGVNMTLASSVLAANDAHTHAVVDRAASLIGPLKGRRVAALGLAFKAETDDVRESPAIRIVDELARRGADVSAYDPQAMENARAVLSASVHLSDSEDEAVTDADAAIILTEWNQFRGIDLPRLRQRMRGNVLLDTRNVLDRTEAKRAGFRYAGMGVPITLAT